MKNYLSWLYICGLLLFISSIYSCTKQEEAIQASAQNIYPLNYYGYYGDDWFLTHNELGVMNAIPQINSFNKTKLDRIAFNFTNSQFSQNLVDTFPPFFEGGFLCQMYKSKLIQLDETHFLQVNTIWRGNSSANGYTKIYLTDSHLKNKILITNRDSTYDVNFASLLPDGRIVLLEKSIPITSLSKLSCLNSDYTFSWVKYLTSGYSTYIPNKDLVINGNSIYVLQHRLSNGTRPNILFIYDFNGNLKKLDKMLSYEKEYQFGYLTATQSGIVLTGMKYNAVSHRQDFCFLSLDKDLNLIAENIIPIVTALPDWEFFLNDFYYGFSDVIPKPIMVNNFLWMPVPYYTDRTGSSLKLIKFNQSLQVELIKPIISNIEQYIPRVAIRANEDYMYLGGSNYKGCFFYRMDKMGNFK